MTSGEGSFDEWSGGGGTHRAVTAPLAQPGKDAFTQRHGQPPHCSKKSLGAVLSYPPHTPSNLSSTVSVHSGETPNLGTSSPLPTELLSSELSSVFTQKGLYRDFEFPSNQPPSLSSKYISSWVSLPSNTLQEGTLRHKPPQRDIRHSESCLTGSTKELAQRLQSQLQFTEDSGWLQGLN